jgi:membrane-associated protease RseP (regulator of RpoE activity)
MHPVVFAAWFGMLATAWNLLPFGQFDGGHLVHAVLGDVSREITLMTAGFCLGMCFASPLSWVVMTSLMLVMLYLMGPRHPPVMSDYEPLSAGRRAAALFALLMFVVCFSPVPIAQLP